LSGIGRSRRVVNDGYAGDVRRDLLEQFQPFRRDRVFVKREAGNVAAWAHQALDEAGAHRIADLCEHDRYGSGRLPQRRQG
jgi:hypothetical protein